MAPLVTSVTSAAIAFVRRAMTAPSEVKSQWINPGNVLDVLLLVGGDVIRAALAQLSGSHLPTPVVFSFGWVAYSFSALVSVIGDKTLMPPPDVQSVVINASTGYVRANQSWMLGRLLRDFEDGHWMAEGNKSKLEDMLNPPSRNATSGKAAQNYTGPNVPRQKAGLCISVYEVDPDLETKAIVPGPLFYLGYVVTATQLVVAALPWILWGNTNYMVFVITAGGSCLSYLMGSLPQWRGERFAGREKTKNDFILTRGNGAQHALVILGKGRGLNLEDLATGEGQRATRITQGLVLGSTILWVLLLITVDGLRDHTWFLVAVGGLGSIYTSLAAGLQKRPREVGLPLKWTNQCFVNEKVMIALMEAEEYQVGLGRSMLETFFPGSRSEKENAFWEEAKALELLEKPPFANKKVDARAIEGIQTIQRKMTTSSHPKQQ